jgi:hypothetical protein
MTPFQTTRRGLLVVSAVLVLFGYVVLLTQVLDKNSAQHWGVLSIPQFGERVREYGALTNIVALDTASDPFFGACRKLDLALPINARIYMDDMLGPTNAHRCMLYGYMVYFLFPREVATSLDQPPLIGRDGFSGRAAESRDDLVTARFDVEVAASGNAIKGRPLRNDLAIQPPISPSWFPSRRDAFIAFLLPLLTALTGLELFRLLFPTLHTDLPLLERLGCGFGLGMMAVAAATLGVKLCGFHGRGVVLVATAAGALAAVRHNRTALLAGITAGLPKTVQSLAPMLGAVMFLLVFAAAGVLGLVESDAVAAWMLKAKLQYLYTGKELVAWFSEPRLMHAHLDYPPLMPSLHAATFDSIGRVDEYVTKFWPAWMLLLLIGTVVSTSGKRSGRLPGPSFFLLALMLLPATRLFTESEGGTMPMIFFTSLGFLECALAQLEQEPARLGLGLTLLCGAALVKFEGFVILAAVALWLVLLPATRSVLTHPARSWRAAVFALAAALPFFWLRAHITTLVFESHWAQYALQQPGTTLASMPAFLLMMTTRWFVNPDLATWSADSGHLQWVGKWEGFTSLYHHPTMALAWLTLFMTVAAWLVFRERRMTLVWLVAVILTVLLGFSFVFSSFVSTTSLSRMLEFYTQDIASARYLFPLLVAWSTTVLTLLFRDSVEELPDGPSVEEGEPRVDPSVLT